MTSRSVVFSINCYTLYICRHTRWYFMSYGPLLVTFWQLKMSMLNFSCSTLNIKPKISSSLNAASSGELDSNLSDRGQGTVRWPVDSTAILKSPINPWLGAESKRILTSLKPLLRSLFQLFQAPLCHKQSSSAKIRVAHSQTPRSWSNSSKT